MLAVLAQAQLHPILVFHYNSTIISHYEYVLYGSEVTFLKQLHEIQLTKAKKGLLVFGESDLATLHSLL